MAYASPRVSAVEDGVPLLQEVALGWYLEVDEPRPASASEGEARSITSAERRDSGRTGCKTTGVGGEQRGFDGGKKVRVRKRHFLVDTEGLVVEIRVHRAKLPDQDGIRHLLDPVRDRLLRLS